MFCGNCGTENDDSFKFCFVCGSPLSKGNDSVSAQKSSGSAPKFTSPAQSSGEASKFISPAQSSGGAPQFTSPAQSSGGTSRFTSPAQSSGEMPRFTSPGQGSGGAPKFTSPGQNSGEAPQFTSPEHSAGGAPKFTAPGSNATEIPRFTVPGGTKMCFHHPAERATASCVKCGHYICKECADAFQVTDGEYAGKYLCFDCCESLVEENVRGLKSNKRMTTVLFVLEIIGFVIGFVLGAQTFASSNVWASILGGLIFACIGATLIASLKELFKGIKDTIKEYQDGGGWIWLIIFFIFRLIVIEAKAIVLTVKNTIYYISYLRKTSKFIEEDSQALILMREQLAFTLIRSQNKGVDIDTLIATHPELQTNTYAQSVRANGETAAEEGIRRAATRINEHGEIIREFSAAA